MHSRALLQGLVSTWCCVLCIRTPYTFLLPLCIQLSLTTRVRSYKFTALTLSEVTDYMLLHVPQVMMMPRQSIGALQGGLMTPTCKLIRLQMINQLQKLAEVSCVLSVHRAWHNKLFEQDESCMGLDLDTVRFAVHTSSDRVEKLALSVYKAEWTSVHVNGKEGPYWENHSQSASGYLLDHALVLWT